MAKLSGNASDKNTKIYGKPGNNDDGLEGSSDSEVIDGKSGSDNLSGNGGNDWVKGGSGDDLLSYNETLYQDSSAYYDGGAHYDALMLQLSYSQWLNITLQNDIARYLPWISSQLNDDGIASGELFTFDAFDLNARKFESLRVEVDGVELNPEDEAVTLQDDVYTIDEDAIRVSGIVLENDDVPDLVRLLEITEGVTLGAVEIDPRFGNFTYTFDDIFQSLAVGESATQTFVYQVSDTDLDTDTATVEIIITGVNDTPEAFDDTVGTTENQSVTIDVLANDTDIDMTDTHTVDSVLVVDDGRTGAPTTQPSPTASIVGNQVVFTPGTAYDYLSLNDTASAVVRYVMSDQHGAASTADLRITITGLNDAPIAVADAASVNEDSGITVSVLDNDYDVDQADTITLTSVTQSPKGGIASIADGSIVFSTDGDFESLNVGETEEVIIPYLISDNHGATADAELRLQVTGVNDAPVAFMDEASTTESSSVLIDVLDNDTDVDEGHSFSISSARLVHGKGNVSISNNQIRFDPNGQYEHVGLGQQAEAIIEYTMEDEHGAQSTSAAFVTINGEYDAPTFVESLTRLNTTMSYEKATDWHFARLDEVGKASSIDFGTASAANNWNSHYSMGFENQSIFGLGEDGLRVEAAEAGIKIDPASVTLINLDLYSDEVNSGAQFKATMNPYFEFSITPFAEITGGVVDNASHRVNAGISNVSHSGDYSYFTTTSAASQSNTISIDAPDSYGVGLDAYIKAMLSFNAYAKWGFLEGEGASQEWDWTTSENLINAEEDFLLLGSAVNAKEGSLDLTMFDQTLSLFGGDDKGIALPKGIGFVDFYDESEEIITSSTSGDSTSVEVLQKIIGLSLDIDDILGLLPRVGTVFAYLDYSKTWGISSVGSLKVAYTLAGLNFDLDLALDIDSSTTSEMTVDLLFDKPVFVEGIDDAVIALRDVDWNNLPGMRSWDGSAVSVLPLFNSQLDYENELSLDLLGTLDYKIGQMSATVTLADIIDATASVGPLVDDETQLFNVDLVTLDTIGYGVTGYDQFAGNAFVLA